MGATWLLLATVACEPVSGAEALLRPDAVVLLGEIHGTKESPEMVSRLVCLALEKGLAVTIGLEIPITEQERVDRFLSDGEFADLLAGAFWSRDYQDGRSSVAMFDLLSTLRRFSGDSQSLVEVLLIDDPGAEGGRDRFMAGRLAERIAGAPASLFIVLTGNLHNRLSIGTRFDPGYEPMGVSLSRRLPTTSIISLQITHGGGSAWICTGGEPGDCGPRELQGRAGAPGIELSDRDEPFSGRYHVERITASPPAREAR